jgi:hypothetical protein
MRQKIRQNFKDNGRGYHVPDARFYPMAPQIVPTENGGQEHVKWWIPLEKKEEIKEKN